MTLYKSTLTAISTLPRHVREELGQSFRAFNYHPDGVVPESILKETEVLLGKELPKNISSLQDMPKLIFQQLPIAGANKAYNHPVLADALKNGIRPHFQLSTASGTHTVSIPQYVVAVTLSLLMQLPKQIMIARSEARWPKNEEIADARAVYDPEVSTNESAFTNLSVRGRTVGLLGYGHLGRESARLMKALGARIIACNSTGQARPDTGYTIPGTGDKDGSIPEKYYSSNDDSSLSEFLKSTDILVASLPGTADTQYFLTKERLALLRPNSVLVNVGRGSFVRSGDLLDALNKDDGLLGAGIDVTDPEPLPDGHPLFTHPRVIVTPHSSGEAEHELEIGADILKQNVELLSEGKPPMNLVDWKKGY